MKWYYLSKTKKKTKKKEHDVLGISFNNSNVETFQFVSFVVDFYHVVYVCQSTGNFLYFYITFLIFLANVKQLIHNCKFQLDSVANCGEQ